jgi:glutamate/tyrosine decarboxylase-like PLP-dependent enzyme
MIDPIDEMASIAYEREISFHVDACVGGYFLPFKEKLGHDVRLWDFRVPGVTTISADLHKFGYTAKGASAIISRDPDIYQYQIFDFGPPNRPSGYYQTPTIAGSRPGGAVAAAWAVMNYLGEEGYMRLVDKTMCYIRKFQERINSIEGLFVMGEPDMSVFAYSSKTLDIYAVATGMEDKGWMVSKDSIPVKAIHFMQSPGHEPFVADYLNDLEEVVELVAQGKITPKGPSANYN